MADPTAEGPELCVPLRRKKGWSYTECLTPLEGLSSWGIAQTSEASAFLVSQRKTSLKPPNTDQGPSESHGTPLQEAFPAARVSWGVPTCRPFKMRSQDPAETTRTIFKPFVCSRASNLKSLGKRGQVNRVSRGPLPPEEKKTVTGSGR